MSTHHDRVSDRINIAIDGPAGAGKSTVARSVAEALGYIYIDTGAMYRAVTWSALTAGIDIGDDAALAEHAQGLDISLAPGPASQIVLLNGQDITSLIRSRDVNLHVSQASANNKVRLLLVDKQRKLASGKGVVMDGRDIGSHVLPDAELKIYLTASVEERALRRFRETDPAAGLSLQQLEKEIEERDRKDMQRAVSPLVRTAEHILVDTTGIPASEVIDTIAALGRKKLAEANLP